MQMAPSGCGSTGSLEEELTHFTTLDLEYPAVCWGWEASFEKQLAGSHCPKAWVSAPGLMFKGAVVACVYQISRSQREVLLCFGGAESLGLSGDQSSYCKTPA